MTPRTLKCSWISYLNKGKRSEPKRRVSFTPRSAFSKQMIKYWFYAARPKTLSGALLPVVTASALAYSEGNFLLLPALLCCLFAAMMQVAANFINDLFDFLKGSDGEDRLGPDRACALGWITPKAMKIGIVLTLTVACLCGLSLIYFGGIELIWIGVACVIFAFLYTTLLSYMGCGDLLVWIFFGFIPVCGTYYVQTHSLTPSAWWLAAGCGLVTDTLLVLNNFRDRTQDAKSGKRTLIVVWGEKFGSLFYLFQGLAAFFCAALLAIYGHTWSAILPLLYIPLHLSTWRKMNKINQGRELNLILGLTSRNMLAYAALVTLALALK